MRILQIRATADELYLLDRGLITNNNYVVAERGTRERLSSGQNTDVAVA